MLISSLRLAALPKAVEARYLRTTGPLLQLGAPDGARWAEGDREAKLAGGGSVKADDESVAKGASRPRNLKGVGASTRRYSVTDRSRMRLKSERVGRIMPAVAEAARSFWSQLKIAMIERAAVRGMDLGQIDWPE